MKRVSLHLFGCGNVGGKLLRILEERASAIADKDGIDLRVVAITTTKGTRFDRDGLVLERLERTVPRAVRVRSVLRKVSKLERPIFVDVSAFDGARHLYEEAFRLGIAVVTANKIPLVSKAADHRALFDGARSAGCSFFYETTVGADLPVLGPIAERRQSGDEVVRIEGSLSGTLGFLSDAVSRGESFSVALETARSRGYTEPDPNEDLAGRDVARKALILAREVGLSLELEDVRLEPFTRGLDPTAFDAYARDVARRGKVLRYLAVIDPRAQTPVVVGPSEVDRDHPAASLRGTEAMVCLRTSRCGDVPVVVRGPGAGGSVTASGVLADILRAARSLDGRGQTVDSRRPRRAARTRYLEGQYLR